MIPDSREDAELARTSMVEIKRANRWKSGHTLVEETCWGMTQAVTQWFVPIYLGEGQCHEVRQENWNWRHRKWCCWKRQVRLVHSNYIHSHPIEANTHQWKRKSAVSCMLIWASAYFFGMFTQVVIYDDCFHILEIFFKFSVKDIPLLEY